MPDLCLWLPKLHPTRKLRGVRSSIFSFSCFDPYNILCVVSCSMHSPYVPHSYPLACQDQPQGLLAYDVLNDTAMLWGIKFYNDLLSQAGPLGNVQSEMLFRKDQSTFTFDKRWAFPRRLYFNGDNCVMPPPDAYPWLPNSGPSGDKKGTLQLPVKLLSATSEEMGADHETIFFKHTTSS